MLRTGELKNVRHTGTLMVRLAQRYHKDIAPFGHFSPNEFYNFLKGIPYHRDPENEEFLQRPYYTLAGDRPGGDCDDKAICSGAYAVLHGYPFRFVAMGKMKDKPLHHVATDMYLNGSWLHFDPTYSDQVMGKYLFRPEKKMIIGAWHGQVIGT